MRTKVIAIVGPTASGKTVLSLEIAKQFSGEIISADSRQVYRTLDIGTEKITEEDMQGIPHHLIDVCDPNDVFSVSDFKEQAKVAIEEINARGNVPIIAGGTGFYIDALLYNLDFPEVAPNRKLREKLEPLSEEELFRMLQEKDSHRASTIDPHNKRRLIRALEIVESLGYVPSIENTVPVYDAYIIGVQIDDELLKEKIVARLQKQLDMGLLKEIENAHERGVSWERLDELGLEYRIGAAFLREEISEEEMFEQMCFSLLHYAKRQKTWFKRNENIHWFKHEDRDNLIREVDAFLKKV